MDNYWVILYSFMIICIFRFFLSSEVISVIFIQGRLGRVVVVGGGSGRFMMIDGRRYDNRLLFGGNRGMMEVLGVGTGFFLCFMSVEFVFLEIRCWGYVHT